MALHVASPMLSTSPLSDPDAMDIDIELDGVDDFAKVELEDLSEEGEARPPTAVNTPASVIAAAYTEEPAQEAQPDRVHIRGVDDFHTSDITSFANDHFASHEPSYIQWIDDTSANIVYSSPSMALQALLSFTFTPATAEEVSASPFQLRTAKSLSTRPGSMLQIRVAHISDKKKKGAKDASRYYLLHPDQDPREQMRKEFQTSSHTRRGTENGDYRRRRYDDREHKRRRDNDATNGGDPTTTFSASMYDDRPSHAPAQNMTSRGRYLSSRTSVWPYRNRSASPGASMANSDEIDLSDLSDQDNQVRQAKPDRSRFRYRSPPPKYSTRDPNPFPVTNASKELFPFQETAVTNSTREGTFRSDALECLPSPLLSRTSLNGSSSAAARKIKVDLLSSPRAQNHRRSNAMDAANDEDLAQRFGRKSLSDLKPVNRNVGKELLPYSVGTSRDVEDSPTGLRIKGAALGGPNIESSGQGLTIKGAAGQPNTRELFPNLYREDKGVRNGRKELFSDKIRERGTRMRADDYH